MVINVNQSFHWAWRLKCLAMVAWLFFSGGNLARSQCLLGNTCDAQGVEKTTTYRVRGGLNSSSKTHPLHILMLSCLRFDLKSRNWKLKLEQRGNPTFTRRLWKRSLVGFQTLSTLRDGQSNTSILLLFTGIWRLCLVWCYNINKWDTMCSSLLRTSKGCWGTNISPCIGLMQG